MMQAEVRLQDVDGVLRERGVRLRFPSPVEAAFQRDTDAQRRHHPVRFGVLALLIYNLFLMNAYMFRPEVFDIALASRLGLATCYGLLIILIANYRLEWLERESHLQLLREPLRMRDTHLLQADRCLVRVAAEIRQSTRAGTGFVARYGGEETDFDAVFRRTDRALYRAKDGGRNRVVLAQNPLSMETGP